MVPLWLVKLWLWMLRGLQTMLAAGGQADVVRVVVGGFYAGCGKEETRLCDAVSAFRRATGVAGVRVCVGADVYARKLEGAR